MPQGNCTVTVTPTDLHTDLLSKTRTDYIVVTGSGATSIKMPTGIPFEVTAPSEASIFIGTKDLHYKAFNEIKPRTSVDNDNSTKIIHIYI